MHRSKPSRQCFIDMPYGRFLAAAWRTRGHWSLEVRPADDVAFEWRMTRMPPDRPAPDSRMREHESIMLAARLALDVSWCELRRSAMPQPTGPFGEGKVIASGWGERGRIPVHDGEALTRPVLQAAESIDGCAVGPVTVRVLPNWLKVCFERDDKLDAMVAECLPDRGRYRDKEGWCLPFEAVPHVRKFLNRVSAAHRSAPAP